MAALAGPREASVVDLTGESDSDSTLSLLSEEASPAPSSAASFWRDLLPMDGAEDDFKEHSPPPGPPITGRRRPMAFEMTPLPRPARRRRLSTGPAHARPPPMSPEEFRAMQQTIRQAEEAHREMQAIEASGELQRILEATREPRLPTLPAALTLPRTPPRAPG